MTAAERGVPSARELLAAAGALVAYNGALNLAPGLNPVARHARLYVPANLALTGVALGVGRRWGLAAADVGLGAGRLARGVALGGAVAAGGGAALALARSLPGARMLLADRRATGLTGPALASYALVRIPFGTALPEEAIFRGVLAEGFARRLPRAPAVLASSAVFGLWHVGPTLRLLELNGVDLGPGRTVLAVAGSVVATAVAGLGFAALRRWGGGLAAPVIAHAGVNVASLLAAAAHQRSAGNPPTAAG